MWPRLQRITFDLSTFSDLIYIRILEGSPQSIIVRFVEPAFDLTTHEKVCRLETMKIGDPMMDEPWPAPGGLFWEDGDFENRFIWGETYRAKGPNLFLERSESTLLGFLVVKLTLCHRLKNQNE